jgi:hypothetical protein
MRRRGVKVQRWREGGSSFNDETRYFLIFVFLNFNHLIHIHFICTTSHSSMEEITNNLCSNKHAQQVEIFPKI